MLKDITKVLVNKSGLTGREIANMIGKDKREVNSYLSKNHKGLYKDNNHKWHPLPPEQAIQITSNPWVTADSFEQDLLKAGCCFDPSKANIRFLFLKDCQILLVAIARIMALTNQLAQEGKIITLDFDDSRKAFHYFNRLGFFDCLDSRIRVLPKRPRHSKAQTYKGNSENLVEVSKLEPQKPDETLPEQLAKAFAHHAGDKYLTPAFTIFGELLANIEDHSHTKLDGFAALQKYKGYGNLPAHIQTVVSDCGLGIATTLRKDFQKHYPEIYEKLQRSSHGLDAALVLYSLTEGGISEFGPKEERGGGLKRSQMIAVKFSGTIYVRQENFEIQLSYKNGDLAREQVSLNLPTMFGTQVCFDFFID